MIYTYAVNGMTCMGCASKVKTKLDAHPQITLVDVSLENSIAKLTMKSYVAKEELQRLFGKDSKYTINLIEKKDVNENIKMKLATYKPLILIFIFITCISYFASSDYGEINTMQWMGNFMAGFFIVFSFFKFLDIKGFADSYAKYDLLAKKIRSYGLIYPFIELFIGIAYLIHYEPKFTYILTIAVMSFSSIGVVKSVVEKKRIQCACLGAVFKLPMSTVTIIENLIMLLMASLMLWIAY